MTNQPKPEVTDKCRNCGYGKTAHAWQLPGRSCKNYEPEAEPEVKCQHCDKNQGAHDDGRCIGIGEGWFWEPPPSAKPEVKDIEQFRQSPPDLSDGVCNWASCKAAYNAGCSSLGLLDRHELTHFVVKLQAQYDALLAFAEEQGKEIDDLKDSLELSRQLESAKLPCGHFSRYGFTDDGGKTGYCTLCQLKAMEEVVEAERWRPMDTAPVDGTRILVDFGSVGVHAVSWDEACNGNTGWVVDDHKHGPYSLRGYVESEVLGWMPLPVGIVLGRVG